MSRDLIALPPHHPLIRNVTAKGKPGPNTVALVKELEDFMVRGVPGRSFVGLAANQVGVNEAVCVVNGPTGTQYAMLNPRVVHKSTPSNRLLEGCLTLPDEWYMVSRHLGIIVEYEDVRTGEPRILSLSDRMAYHFSSSRIAQHEIDHLNGILISDIGQRRGR